MPHDIVTALYYTGIDPFTGEEVYVAQDSRDRKIQRARSQFFSPSIISWCGKRAQGGPLRTAEENFRLSTRPQDRRPATTLLRARRAVEGATRCPSELTHSRIVLNHESDETTPEPSDLAPRPKAASRKFPKSVARPKQGPSDRPEPGRPGPDRFAPRPLPASSPRTSANAKASAPAREALHVAPLDVLAGAAVAVAIEVERAVLGAGKHADRAIAARAPRASRARPPDQRFISQAVFALFRWRGWIDPLRLQRPEARLLLAWLLDAPSVHPACRVLGAHGSAATRACWSRWGMRRTGRRGPKG